MPKNIKARGQRLRFLSEVTRAAAIKAFKNLPPSTGFEPAKLGANGKHVNHHTADDDHLFHKMTCTN
jgi:hypothetical protein